MISADGSTAEKRVFHLLDGLRGVAAICVALHHMATWPIGLRDPMPQAGLAVDMFFVMSGFVLAHAYQHRLDAGMTTWDFMKARLIRLWPLYLLGTLIKLIAVLMLLADSSHPSTLQVLSSIVFALLFLPTPGPLSANGHPFPFNGPAWSLFFELAANFVWVTLFRRSGQWLLAAICLVAAGGLLVIDDLSQTFISGLPRVGFSFFAGILSYRAWKRWPATWRTGGWLAPAILIAAVAVFAGPVSAGAATGYQLAFIALFPAFIWASAKVSVTGRMAAVLKQLGIASYALYVLHDPVVFSIIRLKLFPSLLLLPGPAVAGSILLVLVGLTPLLDEAFDRPIRRWLSSKLALARPPARGAQPAPGASEA